MRFHYTGWLRAQKLVPAANLRVGTNDVMIIERRGHDGFRDSRHANPTQISVGQIRLPARSEIALVRRTEHAFTLLEIMLVVGIIVIILGVAVAGSATRLAWPRTCAVQRRHAGDLDSVKALREREWIFSHNEQGLQALVTPPSGDPKPTRWYQLFKELPTDPWGNTYIYVSPGRKNPDSYDLYSAGPDRKPDTPDDKWGN